jgi:hypothetical protein
VKETLDRCIFLIRQGVQIFEKRWKDLAVLAKRGQIGALIIDTRAKVLANGNSDREEDQAAVSSELTRLTQLGGFPTFTISHSPKSDPDDMSGSGQRRAGVDNLLTVKGRRDKKTKQVVASIVTVRKLRDDLVEAPLPVEFAIKRDPKTDRYVLHDNAEALAEPLPDLVLRAVDRLFKASAARQPITANAIELDLGRNHADVTAALDELVSKGGHIVRVPISKGKAKEGFVPARECPTKVSDPGCPTNVSDVPPPEAGGSPTQGKNQ